MDANFKTLENLITAWKFESTILVMAIAHQFGTDSFFVRMMISCYEREIRDQETVNPEVAAHLREALEQVLEMVGERPPPAPRPN